MISRRHFIQRITAASITLPFLKSINDSMKKTSKDDKILRVAIMGLGSYASPVAQAMNDCKKAKLVGLISGTPSKIADWQKKYNVVASNCYNYENYDSIKDNPEIDAVYVITPNALHHDAVIRIAKAGKQVICEKPMAISVVQVYEMIDACKIANVNLLVAYRMLFETHTLKVIGKRE